MRTLEEKVLRYERLLHQIQMCSEVCLNAEKVGNLIRNICRWSYAHRSGNGEISEEEQQARIDRAFDRLLDTDDQGEVK